MNPSEKYRPFKPVPMAARAWPQNHVARAPIWCSVDLRDGNQALAEPLCLEDKLRFFEALVAMGFKQIEVGFPSASQVEYEMVRALITRDLIPEDVMIQVLVQAREHLIRKTFESLEGCERAIVHLYTNTSPIFRQMVYKTDLQGLCAITVRGAQLIREMAQRRPDGGAGLTFEYSPEGFSDTPPDDALAVCAAAAAALGATQARKVILNLPSTVEVASSNYFADQVEYFIRHLPMREACVISVHPHNDRGTGVADAELAMLAGAERIEGTLFGNGERTGNVDLITVALNLYTQGIDPGLDFSHLNEIKALYERLTKMHIHERQPYTGDLVFTAFSGSHQDAIKKGFDYLREHGMPVWKMPYLTIDPHDLGRSYEPIIRINSQSGKGGAAYILQAHYGYNLPKGMHPEFGKLVQREADKSGAELTAEQLLRLFVREYVDVHSPYQLLRHDIVERGGDGRSSVSFTGTIAYRSRKYDLRGEGNGPIDAFFGAMQEAHIDGFRFASYHEHAISSGADARAVAYIELKYREESVYGVGIDSNVSIASIKGVLCAVNRALQGEEARA